VVGVSLLQHIDEIHQRHLASAGCLFLLSPTAHDRGIREKGVSVVAGAACPCRGSAFLENGAKSLRAKRLSHAFREHLGGNGELSYAGLFGRNEVHGTEYFGDQIPEAIFQQLGRLDSDKT
jgi:hypothetical protein